MNCSKYQKLPSKFRTWEAEQKNAAVFLLNHGIHASFMGGGVKQTSFTWQFCVKVTFFGVGEVVSEVHVTL